jgi:hypothetical protein
MAWRKGEEERGRGGEERAGRLRPRSICGGPRCSVVTPRELFVDTCGHLGQSGDWQGRTMLWTGAPRLMLA